MIGMSALAALPCGAKVPDATGDGTGRYDSPPYSCTLVRAHHGAGSRALTAPFAARRTTVVRPASFGRRSSHHVTSPMTIGKATLIRSPATCAAEMGDGQAPYGPCGSASSVSTAAPGSASGPSVAPIFAVTLSVIGISCPTCPARFAIRDNQAGMMRSGPRRGVLAPVLVCRQSGDAGRASEQGSAQTSRTGRCRDVELVERGAAEGAACHVRGRQPHHSGQPSACVVSLDDRAAPDGDPNAALHVDCQAIGHDIA